MPKNSNKYIFGPVASRRLGRSLGIDIIPFKICSFDCSYCELGLTTDKTLTIKEYTPVNDILQELDFFLKNDKNIDYITITGSGEPTLHSGLKDIITKIKKIYNIPIAVLTNSSLFYVKEVRESLMQADLVVPSLDSAIEKTYRRINRPPSTLSLNTIIDGLKIFSKDFKGKLWLEILILEKINDTKIEFKALNKIIGEMNITKVQLNTVDRPPALESVKKVSYEKLKELSVFINHPHIEIITKQQAPLTTENKKIDATILIELISRRPCTMEDMAIGLKTGINIILPIINNLITNEKVIEYLMEDKKFYKINKNI